MTYQYLKDLYTKQNRTNAIYRVEDRATIPFYPANTDYQTYLKWLEKGNTPLPADE
jgi:hypothetical protein